MLVLYRSMGAVSVEKLADLFMKDLFEQPVMW